MDEDRILGRYAGFASRLAAYFADVAILSLIGIVAAWASFVLLKTVGIDLRNCDAVEARNPLRGQVCHLTLWAAPFTGTLFSIAYSLFFWSTTGQTPGKAIMGVRIVRLDGRPMNLATALRRFAGYLVSYATIGLGFLTILVDDRRQGWHDKLGGTCVLYSWNAREGAPRARGTDAT